MFLCIAYLIVVHSSNPISVCRTQKNIVPTLDLNLILHDCFISFRVVCFDPHFGR